MAVDPAVETTTDLVAAKIRATAFTGWTTGGTGSTVTFTATAVGTKTDATYSAGTTGATGTMTTTTQGVAAATTTIVATAIRAAVFAGWTTGGTGAVVTFTATTVGTRTAPGFSGGATGATGTFVRTAIGEAANFHRYFWNDTSWTDGGAYQAIEMVNDSVSTGHMKANSVGAKQVQPNSISSAKLAKNNQEIFHVENDVVGSIIESSFYTEAGAVQSATTFYIGHKIPVTELRTYRFSPVAVNLSIIGAWFNSSDVQIARCTCPSTGGTFERQSPAGAAYLRMNMFKANPITSVIDLVGDPAVKTENLANESVTAEKLSIGSVTWPKIDESTRLKITNLEEQVSAVTAQESLLKTANTATYTFPGTPSNSSGMIDELIPNVPQGTDFNQVRVFVAYVGNPESSSMTAKVYPAKVDGVYEEVNLITSASIAPSDINATAQTLSTGATNAQVLATFPNSFIKFTFPETVINDYVGGVDVVISTDDNSALPTVILAATNTSEVRGFRQYPSTVLQPWLTTKPVFSYDLITSLTLFEGVQSVVDASVTNHTHTLTDNSPTRGEGPLTAKSTSNFSSNYSDNHPLIEPSSTSLNTVSKIILNFNQGYAFNRVRSHLINVGVFTADILVKVYKHNDTYLYDDETELIASTLVPNAAAMQTIITTVPGLTDAEYIALQANSYVEALFDETILNDQVGGVDIMITTADNTVDALPTIVNGAKTTQVAAFGRFANKAAVNTIFQYNVPCMAIQVFQDVVGGLFEVIDEKISQALTSDIRSLVLNYTPSRYFDRELCREKLAAFFERLHNREHMKVVFMATVSPTSRTQKC